MSCVVSRIAELLHSPKDDELMLSSDGLHGLAARLLSVADQLKKAHDGSTRSFSGYQL